jgi:hypothetical protein
MLYKIAIDHSLYLNSANLAISKPIRAFVDELNDILFPEKESYFELFGSIRNKMALLDNYDIDLTVIFTKERKINYNYSIKINDFEYL